MNNKEILQRVRSELQQASDATTNAVEVLRPHLESGDAILCCQCLDLLVLKQGITSTLRDLDERIKLCGQS